MTHSNDTSAIPDSDAVLQSWQDNAVPWTDSVREAKIASRTLVTNQAIVDAILSFEPQRVLDLGCGEGWLSWQLAARHISVLGVDAIATLIEAAEKFIKPGHPPPQFRVLPYTEVPQELQGETFDLIVCNFSLLDRDDVTRLLGAIPKLLTHDGVFLIQTLHPEFIGSPESRMDGWRSESWQGMGDGFRGQAPWYYRTLASWRSLFTASQLLLCETLEPIHPVTGLPASIIFVLQRAD